MPAWVQAYLIFYWWVALPCVCITSLIYGDRLLRSAVLSYTVLVLIGLVGRSSLPFGRLESVVAATDVLLLCCLTGLAIRCPKPWLLTAAALQLLATVGHLPMALHQVTRLGYALMTNIGAYPILLTFAVPLVHAIRAQSARGSPPACASRDAIPKG